MSSIQIRNVSKSFGDFKALENINIKVEQGTFLTIVGPSGSGKTTLLRIIAGFDYPDKGGDIVIDDKPSQALPPHKRSIGMVFQRLALFPHMNVEQNIAYPLKMRKFPKNEISDIANHYLKVVHLDGMNRRKINELSGGQQQRVAIARALSFNPDVLLLDEPLSALDKKLQEEMQLEFRRIQQELGVTTINVTHNQKEALVMSDSIVVMNDAKIEQHDKPTSIYNSPKTLFVANFIGLSNTFKASIISIDEDFIKLMADDFVFTSDKKLQNKDVNMVNCNIKAEAIHIIKGDEVFDNSLKGVIEQVIFEGDRVVYKVKVDFVNMPLSVLSYAKGRVLDVKEQILLGFYAKDVHIFNT